MASAEDLVGVVNQGGCWAHNLDRRTRDPQMELAGSG